MESWDSEVVAAWQDKGFDPERAVAWLEVAPGRFTQWTARLWIAEGFGPRDAALWSDVFADPRAARERRSEGYSDPFDTEEAQR
jgi:hypothetical protein